MKCTICFKQKGKRDCPVLHKTICPICCYHERIGGLACLETCRYYLKAKVIEREKSTKNNKTFYNELFREFINKPEKYLDFFKVISSKILELEEKDRFLEDVHVIEGLNLAFDHYKARVEKVDFPADVSLNRIGLVKTTIEETILQYKIENKSVTDRDILVGLYQFKELATIKREGQTDPKYFLQDLKSLMDEFYSLNNNQKADSIFLEGN